MANKSKKNRKISIRFWTNVLIFALLVGGLFWGCSRVLASLGQSRYFTIKEVLYDPSLEFIRAQLVQRLVGRNLFAIDVKELHGQLVRLYPQIANLRIVKRYPNKILIIAKQRVPFAQVQHGKDVLVIDKEGTVLSTILSPQGQWPVISGFKSSRTDVKPGSVIRAKSLWLALDVIEKIQLSPRLSAYKIQRIDVDSLSQISVFLLGIPKIIVDNDDVDQKLKVLSLLLTQGKFDVQSIDYIDLRFKEPVLGKK